MQHDYAVDLLVDLREDVPTALVTTHVEARDGYEAVAIARRQVERHHPQIDLASIDTWFVPRRIG
jgi:hypothetical protein